MVEERANFVYNDLLNSRTQLVLLYESNGIIRFDIATGLAYYDVNGILQENIKYIKQFDEFGNLITNLEGVPVLKKVIDFDAISILNKNEGIISGTMMDALIHRATGKVVQLYADDKCLEWGMIILGTTECLLRIMDNILFLPKNLFPIFQTSDLLNNAGSVINESSNGLVHSLLNKVEVYSLLQRGQYKSYNYKGDAELLNNPISLWSQTDISRMSTSTFGSNSLIRMYGKNQVVDINGKEISFHECTNIVAGFSSIITLSDGHFNALTTKSCDNCFVYSSNIIGILSRSNHFGIIGHRCNRILIENIQFGKIIAKNKGTYFASILFNNSNTIVAKSIIQEQLNHNVTRSSLGLSWYSDLTVSEILFGKNIRVEDWNIYSQILVWLKWENILPGEIDKFNNGKKTVYPVIKSITELEGLIGLDGAVKVYEYLRDAQEAYRASIKNADDHGIQIDIIHGRNFEPLTNNEVLVGAQVPRTTNLVVANALNRTFMNMYPDSTSYGFRAGNSESGTHNLAKTLSLTPNNDIYVLDCIFNEFSVSLMEVVSLLNINGLINALNGQAIRPFGYSNNRNPSAGVASSSMLLSSDYLANVFNKTEAKFLAPPSLPYVININGDYVLDSAKIAFNNLPVESQTLWGSSINLNGLYKGNDVLENSLANITAMGILQKYFPQSLFFINGINNSHLDIGILAWRKSMMDALGASSASNIGLKGGFKGSISDYNPGQSTANTEFQGEIYPWYVSKNTKDIITYDIIIELINNENVVTFIKEFHNLHINDNVIILINNVFINCKVLKVLSSQKIVIDNPLNNLQYNTNIFLINYVGTRLDNTKTPDIIIDKDRDYFNTIDKINHLRETVTEGYIGAIIPNPNFNLLRFKIKMLNNLRPDEGVLIYLVRCGDNNIDQYITYRECANILGFDTVGTQFINLDNIVVYHLAHNLDGQNHTHKGTFGIRLDQIKSCAAINCNFGITETVGFSQEVNLIGNSNLMNKLDITQDLRPGTHINDVHGVSINGCENILVKNVIVDTVQGLGNIYGVETYGHSNKIDITQVTCNNINAGLIYGVGIGPVLVPNPDPFGLSNKVYYYPTFLPQDSVGVHVAETSTNINLDLKTITGINITSPSPNLAELIRREKN
jgi:hypothetical protein